MSCILGSFVGDSLGAGAACISRPRVGCILSPLTFTGSTPETRDEDGGHTCFGPKICLVYVKYLYFFHEPVVKYLYFFHEPN